MYFVYLLECADGSIYTGITTDVVRRLKEHQEGKLGAHYTRAKKAVRMVYSEKHPDRSSASKREAQVKKMPRAKKLALAASGTLSGMKKQTPAIGMTVSAYMKGFPKSVQTRLAALRAAVKKAAPTAEEGIWYGMPGYKLNGRPLVYFAGFKNHIGVFPTPRGVAAFKKDLVPYQTAKGSIQFPHASALPMPLIKKIIAYRVKEEKTKVKKA